jgi:hypothetical protein
MAALVEGSVVLPPLGRVPLSDKLIPLCQRELREDEALAYTYKQLDTSEFKKYLLSCPPDVWEDDYHAVHNVKMTRPAHDAWGIKKIMFTFCDDFLQKVIDLPFSQAEEWRRFLLPIYEACGVPESRVVRSLLASMPPGSTIPVHHDTGYWVQHTHRMHVAICSDSDTVFFYVGHKDEPGEAGLHKYEFNEGRLVELNNQAKHAVTNNWDQNRVHFIFDYVDEGFPVQRFTMSPGETLNQTRRSIDLKRHAGSRPTPSFVIIGAQKCGTTSMYEYLCGHPLVARGVRRETHYFDWRWDSSLGEDDAEGHRAAYLKYYNPDLYHHPSILTGESTPSYLLHADLVIPRLKMVSPHLRSFLVMLRDPVERAYSQYRMSVDLSGNAEQLAVRGQSSYVQKTFLQVVEEEIGALRAAGIEPGSTWEEFRIGAISGLPMGHGGHSTVLRGLYALQLLPWIAEYGISNLMVLSIGAIKGDRAQGTMDSVFQFVGLPPHKLADTTPKNTRPTEAPMDEKARQMLQDFYEPYNERLFALLGRRLVDW